MHFFKAFGGYAIGSALFAGAGFISIPILIRLLGNHEFGRWVLLEPVLLIGAQLSLLGINGGIFKQVAHDGIPVRYAFRKLMLMAQPAAILFSIVLALGVGWLGYSITEQAVTAMLIWFEAILLFSVSSLRAANLSSYFAIVQGFRSTSLLVFLAAALYGWVVIANVSSVLIIRLGIAAVAILLVFVIMPKEKSSLSGCGVQSRAEQSLNLGAWPLYADATRYGFPLLLTGILIMGFQFSDRFILKLVTNYNVLAEYVVHLKLVSALNLIITPFSLWWPTERFLRRKDVDGGQAFFRAVANVFLVVLLAIGGCLWLWAEWLLPIYAPSVMVSTHLMFVLILSAVFFAMAYPLNVGLLDEGKTHKTIWGALIGLCIQIVLCLVLIPYIGVLGAAYANLVGSFLYVVVLHIMSQYVHKIKFAYASMAILFGMSVAFLIIISTLFSAYIRGSVLVVVFEMVTYLMFLLAVGRLSGVTLPWFLDSHKATKRATKERQ